MAGVDHFVAVVVKVNGLLPISFPRLQLLEPLDDGPLGGAHLALQHLRVALRHGLVGGAGEVRHLLLYLQTELPPHLPHHVPGRAAVGPGVPLHEVLDDEDGGALLVQQVVPILLPTDLWLRLALGLAGEPHLLARPRHQDLGLGHRLGLELRSTDVWELSGTEAGEVQGINHHERDLDLLLPEPVDPLAGEDAAVTEVDLLDLETPLVGPVAGPLVVYGLLPSVPLHPGQGVPLHWADQLHLGPEPGHLRHPPGVGDGRAWNEIYPSVCGLFLLIFSGSAIWYQQLSSPSHNME